MELYNGVIDTLTCANLDSYLLGRYIVLLLSFLSGARFIRRCY